MTKVINSEPLINHVDEYEIILVGTNCYQSLRNGFQLEMSNKYPYIKQCNNLTKYGDINKLGTILECGTEQKPLIILLYITFGFNFKGNDKPYIDYDALNKCLRLVNLKYKGKKIATTLLGSTHFDGNGDCDKIMKILNQNSSNIDLDIYTYEQESYEVQKKKEYFKKKKQRLNFIKNDKETKINARPSEANKPNQI